MRVKFVFLVAMFFSFSLQASDFRSFQEAIYQRDLGKVKELLVVDPNVDVNSKGSVEGGPFSGPTVDAYHKMISPLHFIIMEMYYTNAIAEYIPILEAFLDSWMLNPNAVDGKGYMPLHTAARYLGRIQDGRRVISRLLDHRDVEANKRIYDYMWNMRNTPLDMAALYSQHKSFVEEFLNHPKIEPNNHSYIYQLSPPRFFGLIGHTKVYLRTVDKAALYSRSPEVIGALVNHERVILDRGIFDYFWENRHFDHVVGGGRSFLTREMKKNMWRAIRRQSLVERVRFYFAPSYVKKACGGY